MRRSHLTAILLACAVLFPPLRLLAQSSERPTPVEVVAPKPPTPVTAMGKRVFVYELHVTNLGSAPIAFRRVQVYAGSDNRSAGSRALQVLSDSALRNALAPVGGATAHDVTRLDVGKRTIVYMWITQNASDIVPQRLRHRLEFALLDSAGVPIAGSSSSIDSLWVPVLRNAPVPVLYSPLTPGVWLAGIGPSNDSDHRRALTALEGRGFISQRFAVDWVKVGPNGDTHHDAPNRNENFWAYGQPVLAVADGEVVDVVDGMHDNTPGAPLTGITIKTIAGNHLTLRIGTGEYATYAHLRPGTIRVHPGQRVARGDTLAQLGNSGASTGPHLHLQLTDGPSVLASEGIPFMLASFDFLGYGRDYEPGKEKPVVRSREMPLSDEVIRIH
jgi:murein DD-endopeptidase